VALLCAHWQYSALQCRVLSLRFALFGALRLGFALIGIMRLRDYFRKCSVTTSLVVARSVNTRCGATLQLVVLLCAHWQYSALHCGVTSRSVELSISPSGATLSSVALFLFLIFYVFYATNTPMMPLC
jgi:hypothetical protein